MKLPVMVCQDGFITSHAVENIELLADQEVKEFAGDYVPSHHLLDKSRPISVGPLDHFTISAVIKIHLRKL